MSDSQTHKETETVYTLSEARKEVLRGLDLQSLLNSALASSTSGELYEPPVLQYMLNNTAAKVNGACVVLFNARDYVDLRRWGRDLLELESLRENLIRGIMGFAEGLLLYVSRHVPAGTVFVTNSDGSEVACFHLLKR